MRPPAFWQDDPARPSWQALALAPLGAVYAAATARRIARGEAHRLGVPVISVGNVNVGGTGKTPLAIALAQRLATRGARPAVVTRGYRGAARGPLKVDPRHHDAAAVGDEALLLAAFAPTWVARDRAAGGRAAAAGATVVLLDDAHQNPALSKDLSIVAIDALAGFGNGRVLPAGPLREPVAVGLARADLLVVIGAAAIRRRFLAASGRDIAGPLAEAEIVPLPTGLDWTGLRVLAFAGIGRPGKVFDSLRAAGADVAATRALADHQPLTPALMQRLSRDAARVGARLVTTEKDAVRLPPAWRTEVLTFPVRLEMADWAPVDAALARLGL